ncbi:MAG: WD40 repeat domain-containing protein [Chlamydiota bacterium]
MSRINKLGPCAAGVLALLFTLGLLGCGSSSRVAPSNEAITVSISPNPTASMNLGSTLQFNATVHRGTTVITTPITFISNNKQILQFAPSGLACAGKWDTSFIVCSPGAPGVVTVLASGFGTPSSITTVYVHPQVTNIEVSSLNPSPPACVSQNQTENLQATVLSGNTDITPFVGPLTWSALEPGVAKTSTTVTGLQSNQVQVTAAQPGLTHIFASSSGLNSQGFPFETCPAQSISVVASSTGTDSLSLAKGSSGILTPTVIDSQGNTISVTGSGTTGLTWISSQPGVATSKSASVTAVGPGGAAIFPVCTPPACNVNLHAVYSSNVVSTTVTGTVGAGTVYVASTGCYGTTSCTASLIPINTSTNTAGAAITLSSPPNSMVVDLTGANVYFGTAAGLRIFATSTSAFTGTSSVVGKVLAASPDGTKAIVSNTAGNPNVVYVVDSKASTSSPLLLNGVTAAAFSPDSTTAYLLAGSTLYVYSTTRALQTISLPASASDAAFLTTGTFGFVATPPSTVNLFDGCDNAAPQSPNTPTVTTVSPPELLATLPDGKTMAAVTSPGFTSIAVTTSAAGCPPPVTATPTFHDLGQGPFTPKQVLVSSDGSRLYVVSNLSTVMIYDFTSASVNTITLSGGATPLRAALTLSGQTLYVGASDGTVHVLDTATFTDSQRISVSLCSNSSAGCLPDLVAVRP